MASAAVITPPTSSFNGKTACVSVTKGPASLPVTPGAAWPSTGDKSEHRRDQKFASISQVLEGKQDAWLVCLKEVHKNCCILWQNAGDYDFDARDPGNGFRSLVQVVNRSFDHVDYLVTRQQVKRNQELLHEWQTMTGLLLKMSRMCLRILERDESFRQQGRDVNDRTEVTPVDEELLVTSFSITESEVRPIYSLLGVFWLRPSFQKEYRTLVYMSNLAKCENKSSVIKLLLNKDRMISHLSRHANSASIAGIRSGLDLFTKFPFKTLSDLKWKAKGTAKPVTIPTQDRWSIHLKDSHSLTQVMDRSRGQGSDRPADEVPVVQGLLIGRENLPPSGRRSNTVILHVHGGAFTACVPLHHANYLRVWSRSLSLPILCPEYRKAPESPFPDGLQDVLNTYLFLRSGRPEVEQMLGFQPDQVIVSGDSAGGWFALALTFVLSVMRQQQEGDGEEGGSCSSIPLPSGIVVQYPAVNLSFSVDPSHSLAILEPLLTASLQALCLAVYAKRDTDMQSQTWDPVDAAALVKNLTASMRTRITDPLFNLLAFRNWQALASVPLFVTACEYDPLLDGAISLCKAWAGPVTLDIARGLTHGFLFIPATDHTREDFDKVIAHFHSCVQRLTQQQQQLTAADTGASAADSSNSSQSQV